MPIIPLSRHSGTFLHLSAKLLLVHIAALSYFSRVQLPQHLPPSSSPAPQRVGNGYVSCPHKFSPMRQKDTSGIVIDYVQHHYRAFNRPGHLHVTYFDIFLKVPNKFRYKWVQVVAKDAPKKKDSVICPGADTFYDPFQHEIVFEGSDYPFYYNLLDDEPLNSQPPRIRFYDQPQTEQRNMHWKAQTSLFAIACSQDSASWEWVGTFEWGYTVTNDSKPDTLLFHRIDTGLWQKTQFMIDSLTKSDKHNHPDKLNHP